MILFLTNPERASAAKEVLVELGLEHSLQKSSHGVFFSIQADTAVWSAKQISEKLSAFGAIEDASQSRTPLLDNLGPDYKVEVASPVLKSGKITFEKNPEKAVWIAGPCSLDTPENLRLIARTLSDLGVQVLRAGALKPRTSPHDFQGIGQEGYRWLADIAHEHGMIVVSEVLSEYDIEQAVQHLDILQIGARNMQNFSLLKKIGQTNKPILLKRAPGATLKEWASAAEYVLSTGNRQVILCERGVRGLEKELRYTLDLAGAIWMQERYQLPVVIDPSHATGMKPMLGPCTAGSIAMGFAGVMLETHPRPVESRSDALQALRLEEFADIYCKNT